MPLLVDILINGHVIQTYAAENISGKTYGINEYRILYLNESMKHEIGIIRHKYSDGATVLAKKVMALAVKHQKEQKRLAKEKVNKNG